MDLSTPSNSKDPLVSPANSHPDSIHVSTPSPDNTPARKAWGDTPTSSDSDLQALALQWEKSKKLAEQDKIAAAGRSLETRLVVPKKVAAESKEEDIVEVPRPARSAETGGTADVSDSAFLKVDVASPSSPTSPIFRPRFVKVTGGVANIIGSIGDTLLYVEAEVSGLCRDARVWVLGSYATIKQMFAEQVGSVATRLAAVCNIIRSKSMSFAEPLYASLSSGVLQIWGSIGGAVVCVQVWASQSWTAVSDCTIDLYCAGRQKAIILSQMLSAWFAHAGSLTLTAFEPYLAKIRAGYVDIGTKVVYLKTAALASPTMSKVLDVVEFAKSSTATFSESLQGAAADKDVQLITVTAVGGAAVLGAGGGAVGLATGSVVGAACGAIPAMFTFGLSIPIGTAIGGGAGLCVGTVTGSAAGLLGGGLVGRTASNHREQISNGVNSIRSKASDCKEVILAKVGSRRPVKLAVR